MFLSLLALTLVSMVNMDHTHQDVCKVDLKHHDASYNHDTLKYLLGLGIVEWPNLFQNKPLYLVKEYKKDTNGQ